jgi:nitronate monooxygenase
MSMTWYASSRRPELQWSLSTLDSERFKIHQVVAASAGPATCQARQGKRDQPMNDIRDLSRRPIIVAPMAGGPSTPELVVAAGQAGAVGFLAAGYKTIAAMNAEIAAVRAATDAPFGVNVFVPQASTADPAKLAAYVASLEPDALALRATLGQPGWDDDGWAGKIESLLADPPAVVSFTFGCPPAEMVAAFRDRSALVVVTVTSAAEARAPIAAGADCLCAQGFEAGAHRGTFTNDERPGQDHGLLALIGEIAAVTDVPLIAAGGIGGPRALAAVLAAGAAAAQLGTAFVRCPESGARQAHKDALADPRFTTTAITRAFTGRRARGLVNQFMIDHAGAPPAYPEIHHVTRPLRAAAAAAGDADRLNLWAGQAFRAATDQAAGEIVEQLMSRDETHIPLA